METLEFLQQLYDEHTEDEPFIIECGKEVWTLHRPRDVVAIYDWRKRLVEARVIKDGETLSQEQKDQLEYDWQLFLGSALAACLRLTKEQRQTFTDEFLGLKVVERQKYDFTTKLLQCVGISDRQSDETPFLSQGSSTSPSNESPNSNQESS